MIRLYKKESDELYYAECWVDDNIATVHTGIAGTLGECYEEDCENAKNYLKRFKSEYETKGYSVIPDNEMYWIEIKWCRDSDTPELDENEQECLNAVYDSINEAFGWTGLGYADGFETESDGGKSYIMLYALAVDLELGVETAKNSIEIDKEYSIRGYKFGG